MVQVEVEVEVNPTEDVGKVKEAVENIFRLTEIEPVQQGKTLVLRGRGQGSKSLSSFGSLLRRERIRSAARRIFRQGMSETAITFCLNKQVAYVGHISFSEPTGESPLGPIKVHITTSNPRKLIDWLAPRTR
jgi:predicted RNA binding protein with dsRBD fold (UPF0201 family)